MTVVRIRKETLHAVRDNVIFELGLFVGALGLERTFVVVPRDTKKLRLPTDLLGVTLGTYDANRRDGNLRAALRPVCQDIIRAVKRCGPGRGKSAGDKAALQQILKRLTAIERKDQKILSIMEIPSLSRKSKRRKK